MNEHRQRALGLRAEALSAYKAGAPIGDVSILKFAAMSQPVPAGMNEKLGHLRGYAPIYDPGTLRTLPAGSFGREFAQFLTANGIQHMTYSAEILERFREEPYAMRVAMTHDIHHMLIGGDAGIAGETAVAAFQVGQNTLGTAPRAVSSLVKLALGYTKVRPGRAIRVWGNLWCGWRLGRRTPLLIAHRLEDMFELPLEEVRVRVGLPRDPRTAGIHFTDELDGKPVPLASDPAVHRAAAGESG